MLAREIAAAAEPESGVSLRRLLFEDFRRHDDDREEEAARERLHALAPVPGFLLIIHLVCAGAVVAGLPASAEAGSGAAAVLIAALWLDALLWTLQRWRPVTAMAPPTAMRISAGYTLAAVAAWTAAAVIAVPADGGNALLTVGFTAGVFAVPLAFMMFPGLAAFSAAAAVAGSLLLWHNPAASAAAGLCWLCVLRLSLVRSADRTLRIKRRIAMDWNAQRASRFIEEFEQAGRGWFWETNARGGLTYVSDQLAADLLTNARKLLGQPLAELVAADTSGATDCAERTLGFHLSARLPFTDLSVRARQNPNIWWSLSGTPSFDEFGRFLGFRGVGTDLTEQRRSAEEINRLAKYDSLTGLPNRMLMRRTLDEALANPSSGCALFLIDLDRFKNVNDTLGHPVGDALLKQVAQRLAAITGKAGQIGRLGGDEFKAVLPGTQDEAALGDLAARLIQQVSMPYMIDGHNISIGASIGIAVADRGACADSLIRDADLALYTAKAAGRGTFCFFAPEMHSQAQDRQMLENDLRKAIGRGELELYYQPIVAAQSEVLSGFEALVRWHHPTRGAISPSLFIPLAEETGLILQVGEWVLRTACDDAAKWPDNVRVAVNLSPIQFGEASLPQTVLSALANSGLPPRQLELEITEGVFLVESDSTDAMFASLKSIGVRLALDDFGTGYSSLGYLKKTPFDKIKIDQSFVRGAAKKDSRNAAIVRSIVTLAQSLEMETTAEGAETHDELELIRDLGCSHVQGYIFGRPMNAEEATRLAQQNKTVAAEGFQFNRPPRQGLLKLANLQWNGMQMPVRVRNISTGGALLECDRSIEAEASVQLDVPGCGCVGGRVRWSDGGRMGIQFDDEFDLRRLVSGKGSIFGARLSSQPYIGLKYAEGAVDKSPLKDLDLRYGSQ